MSFGEMQQPSLSDDMKAHISGFHPFTSEVMQVRQSSKWKWPNVETYDETSDLEVHIKSYLTYANLFSDEDTKDALTTTEDEVEIATDPKRRKPRSRGLKQEMVSASRIPMLLQGR